MSFIDQYLDKNRLDKIPAKTKKKLDKLEGKLAKTINSNATPHSFEDCITKLGPRVADLIERVSLHFASFEWSVKGVFGAFRFVMSISTEVFQMVDEVKECVITDGMTEQEQHEAKVTFGKDLVWFIWSTVDPLKGRFSWLPFKKTLEKSLVYWIAGMALDHVVDLFNANAQATSFGVESSVDKKGRLNHKQAFVKALP